MMAGGWLISFCSAPDQKTKISLLFTDARLFWIDEWLSLAKDYIATPAMEPIDDGWWLVDFILFSTGPKDEYIPAVYGCTVVLDRRMAVTGKGLHCYTRYGAH